MYQKFHSILSPSPITITLLESFVLRIVRSVIFGRVRITDFEEEDDIDTKDACTRLKVRIFPSFDQC